MNTKKCYIDFSKIPNAGLGLFAGEKILKDEIVWKKHPSSEIIYTQSHWNNLPIQFKDNIKKYIYKCNDEYHLCLDDSRHYNHSDNPNTDETIDGDNVANRDIEIGEELTTNYSDFNDDAEWVKQILAI